MAVKPAVPAAHFRSFRLLVAGFGTERELVLVGAAEVAVFAWGAWGTVGLRTDSAYLALLRTLASHTHGKLCPPGAV